MAELWGSLQCNMMFDNNGLKGLPCGTPFLRLVSLPFIRMGALNHLRIRNKAKGHFTWRYNNCNSKQ